MTAQALAPARTIEESAAPRRQTDSKRRARAHSGPEPQASPATSRRAPAGTHNFDRNQAMVDLLPLVKRVAFQMQAHLPAHVDFNELVGAGVLGLIDAVRKFDARKHVKLETYARHRIRGAILDGLRSLDTASRDMRKKAKGAEKVYRELERKLGRQASDEEMAAGLGVSLGSWYRTVQELQPVGMDWLRPMEAAELKTPDPETLVADAEEDAFDQCYRSEQKAILNRALTFLSERDRLIMSLYYQQDLTMKAIAEKLGVDESRVSQLHAAALARLRARVSAMLRPTRQAVPPAYMVAELEGPSVTKVRGPLSIAGANAQLPTDPA